MFLMLSHGISLAHKSRPPVSKALNNAIQIGVAFENGKKYFIKDEFEK